MAYQQDFFQVGGGLTATIPSYIKRKADDELFQHLLAGEFCLVLTARQMGKSSLKVRTMDRLKKKDWLVLTVDLTEIGSSGFTSEQWYVSFLSALVNDLMDEDDFDDWWVEHSRLTPIARMSKFWEEVLLKLTDKNIAIFIDEIDLFLSFDNEIFDKNDFFAALRAVYNKRTEKEDFKRLNFTILGVAAPLDLMSADSRTPFNIGEKIQILNIKDTEAKPLQKGFSDKNTAATNQAILNRIIYWSGGQPFLTQQLGKKLANKGCSSSESQPIVDEVVESLYFKNDIFTDEHFSNIENRIVRNADYNLKMLEKYRVIQNNGVYKINDRGNEILYLKLSGLVQEENGMMKVCNRIYEKVFNEAWLDRALETIDRPITMAMNFWEKSGRSKDALLTGEMLIGAEEWKKGREDLTTLEEDFIQASRLAEQEEKAARELAEQEAEAERALQKTKEKQRKRLIWALVVTILFLLITIASFFYANDQRKKAERNAIIANEQTVIATEKTKIAEEQTGIAEEQTEKAEKNLADFIKEQEKNMAVAFDRYAERTKPLINANRCPESLLKDMKAIAKNHPNSSNMWKRINQISKDGNCN